MINTVYESKYGPIRIIEYRNAHDVDIEFINTGTRLTTQIGNIRKGTIKDLNIPTVYGKGYIGQGPHKAKHNSVPQRAYKIWVDMLRRCYSPKSLIQNKTYIGCTVCDEWLNYQNFAEWYYHTYIEGMHLDKDIKFKGNKVYSPSTCSWVTQANNTIASSARYYEFLDPNNTLVNIYNLKNFCKHNNLDNSTMLKVHKGLKQSHKGWTKA